MSLPPLPDSFYWTDRYGVPGLRCRPLDAIAPHLFTSRQLQLSSPADWQRLCEAVGGRHIALLTQVHGCDVVVIRRGSPRPEGRPEADALVSDDPEVAVAVRVADCVPLLLADSRTGAVAAVHAGWRGTAAGIAAAAVAALTREFGSNPADVVAALGPSIGHCCYEIGTDVVDAFAAAGHPRYLIDRWFLATPPPRGVFPRATSAVSQLRLDIAGANRDQLVLAGVPDASIEDAALCTAMHLDVLTSYRVEKANAGRLAGVIRASRRQKVESGR